jgi:hypothetical protein
MHRALKEAQKNAGGVQTDESSGIETWLPHRVRVANDQEKTGILALFAQSKAGRIRNHCQNPCIHQRLLQSNAMTGSLL